jgi:hypothetical protein
VKIFRLIGIIVILVAFSLHRAGRGMPAGGIIRAGMKPACSLDGRHRRCFSGILLHAPFEDFMRPSKSVIVDGLRSGAFVASRGDEAAGLQA